MSDSPCASEALTLFHSMTSERKASDLTRPPKKRVLE